MSQDEHRRDLCAGAGRWIYDRGSMAPMGNLSVRLDTQHILTSPTGNL